MEQIDRESEWLESDALGGFASGTVGGIRTRRYHAVLLAATTPPTGRVVLVNGFEAWIEGRDGSFPISSQRYVPNVTYPDGISRIAGFTATPWPRWTFLDPAGLEVTQELMVHRDTGETVLRWRHMSHGACRLRVRLLLSVRDYHALRREDAAFDMRAIVRGGNVSWRPYPDHPAIAALTNGSYSHEPDWYRNFVYAEECERGLDCIEDLASPGTFDWDLTSDDAVMVLRAGDGLGVRAAPYAAMLVEAEQARRDATGPLGVAADSYLVDRGRGRTLIAGFPWFTDWGRDTFIAMRGLMLITGRLAEAEAILLAWSSTVSEGMLPNRFLDAGGQPEFNAVDASLWFIVLTHEFLLAAAAAGRAVTAESRRRLQDAAEAILQGYAAGTRFAIAADADGLLRAGVPGVQLTWMDAKIGDRVVTPRIGKPVEVQALWINALRIGGEWSQRWSALARHATESFAARFPNPGGGLYDVIDADHVPGATDGKLRPNQILAVGGLPFALLQGAAARTVVDLVEDKLLTPLGLRTLSPDDPDYAPHYRGGPVERDNAYHQGTAWPWLAGPFVDAWLRVRDHSAEAKAEARRRFLAPLQAHLATAGLGHVSEVADGASPHTPGGCPFQAWSLGELIRIEQMLAPTTNERARETP
ncbi:MAG TPA: amylo-alpha-1,6-glucosidase [Acetobacteraceae bacterium]|nr:amylo-alpha-1,6-glucosidase [Acetobacteraceae bacterium]